MKHIFKESWLIPISLFSFFMTVMQLIINKF
jgi:hypothetical protein